MMVSNSGNSLDFDVETMNSKCSTSIILGTSLRQSFPCARRYCGMSRPLIGHCPYHRQVLQLIDPRSIKSKDKSFYQCIPRSVCEFHVSMLALNPLQLQARLLNSSIAIAGCRSLIQWKVQSHCMLHRNPIHILSPEGGRVARNAPTQNNAAVQHYPCTAPVPLSLKSPSANGMETILVRPI